MHMGAQKHPVVEPYEYKHNVASYVVPPDNKETTVCLGLVSEMCSRLLEELVQSVAIV